MKFSRRKIIHAGCTIAVASFVDCAEAGLRLHGRPAFSQRSVINLGFLFENDYAFINHILQGDSSIGPVSSAFTGTDPIWTSVIDANGWPNASSASGKTFGGGWRIPDPANFAGPYVITWTGDGTVTMGLADGLGGTATFTVNAGASSNYTELGNGQYSNTAGLTAKVVFSIATSVAGPRLLFHRMPSTGTAGANFLKNLKIYRQADETDLLAGKVFRTPFKQSLVNLKPSAIRFLNWMGGSAAREYRFENRALPTNAGYATNTNWTVSPVYPAVTGTNQYSVAAATPTAANPRTTPVSYQHGESIAVLFTNTAVRCTPILGPTAMTNANPCKVTTNAAHGFNTGDHIVHWGMSGMGRLVFFPVTIAVVDSLNYTIGIDTTNTTNYPPFTGGGGIAQYLSIDVGGRGAKPMAFPTGDSPFSFFGNFLPAAQYKPLVYDKNVSILGDGAGNPIPGAWMPDIAAGGCSASVPIEIMVALVNEVNALAVSQGISTPIHMWLPIPHTSMTSMDSDYTTALDYALNTVDVILNTGSAQRAGGYSALTAAANLFLEYSNETWNSAGGFWACPYLNRMGSLRWPTSGSTNSVDMYILRSTIIMKALAGTSRLKRVLSGWGISGYSAGTLNPLRVSGSSTPGVAGNFYLTDTITVAGSFGAPISSHDCFCTATYFDAADAYYTATGAGTFTDDSALYAGTAPYGSPNQAQALANFVAAVKSGAGQSIDGYLNNSLSGLTATYSAAMLALGKVAINYEGGPDWNPNAGANLGGGHTETAADSIFLRAALNSTQWRDAQVNYFNRTSQLAGSAMPSVYTYIGGAGDQRWAYCTPDTYASGTEGQALLNSPVWAGMSARNQALSP